MRHRGSGKGGSQCAGFGCACGVSWFLSVASFVFYPYVLGIYILLFDLTHVRQPPYTHTHTRYFHPHDRYFRLGLGFSSNAEPMDQFWVAFLDTKGHVVWYHRERE